MPTLRPSITFNVHAVATVEIEPSRLLHLPDGQSFPIRSLTLKDVEGFYLASIDLLGDRGTDGNAEIKVVSVDP